MTEYTRSWQEVSSEAQYRTTAEDAAMVLSLVVIVVLAAILVAFLALEFLDVLPPHVTRVIVFTLSIFCLVVGRAIVSRALAYPAAYHSEAPILRNIGRRRRRTQAARAGRRLV